MHTNVFTTPLIVLHALYIARKSITMANYCLLSCNQPIIVCVTAEGVESRLRALGFGYRAKYISKTAQMLQSKNDDQWLYKLRAEPYDVARESLLELSGVGPKVSFVLRNLVLCVRTFGMLLVFL